jgi:hypothetical protein
MSSKSKIFTGLLTLLIISLISTYAMAQAHREVAIKPSNLKHKEIERKIV